MGLKVYSGSGEADIGQVQVRNSDNTAWVDIGEVNYTQDGGPTPDFVKVWEKDTSPFHYAKVFDYVLTAGKGAAYALIVPRGPYTGGSGGDGIFGITMKRRRNGFDEVVQCQARMYNVAGNLGSDVLYEPYMNDPEFHALVDNDGDNLPYSSVNKNIILVFMAQAYTVSSEDTVLFGYDPAGTPADNFVNVSTSAKYPTSVDLPLVNKVTEGWTPIYIALNSSGAGQEVQWGHFEDVTALGADPLNASPYTLDTPPATNAPIGWWKAEIDSTWNPNTGLFCAAPTAEPMTTFTPARWTSIGITGNMIPRNNPNAGLTWNNDTKFVTYASSKWFAFKGANATEGVGFHHTNFPGVSDIFAYEDAPTPRTLRTRMHSSNSPVPQPGMPSYVMASTTSNPHIVMSYDYSVNKATMFLGETDQPAEEVLVGPVTDTSGGVLTTYDHFEIGNFTPGDRTQNAVQMWAYGTGKLERSDAFRLLNFMQADQPFLVGGKINPEGSTLTLYFNRALIGDPDVGFYYSPTVSNINPVRHVQLSGGVISGKTITYEINNLNYPDGRIKYAPTEGNMMDSLGRELRGFHRQVTGGLGMYGWTPDSLPGLIGYIDFSEVDYALTTGGVPVGSTDRQKGQNIYKFGGHGLIAEDVAPMGSKNQIFAGGIAPDSLVAPEFSTLQIAIPSADGNIAKIPTPSNGYLGFNIVDYTSSGPSTYQDITVIHGYRYGLYYGEHFKSNALLYKEEVRNYSGTLTPVGSYGGIGMQIALNDTFGTADSRIITPYTQPQVTGAGSTSLVEMSTVTRVHRYNLTNTNGENIKHSVNGVVKQDITMAGGTAVSIPANGPGYTINSYKSIYYGAQITYEAPTGGPTSDLQHFYAILKGDITVDNIAKIDFYIKKCRPFFPTIVDIVTEAGWGGSVAQITYDRDVVQDPIGAFLSTPLTNGFEIGYTNGGSYSTAGITIDHVVLINNMVKVYFNGALPGGATWAVTYERFSDASYANSLLGNYGTVLGQIRSRGVGAPASTFRKIIPSPWGPDYP